MKKTLLTLAAVATLSTLTAQAAWVRIEDQSQLKAGTQYVIVCERFGSIMTTEQVNLNGIDRYRTPLDISAYLEDGTLEAVPAKAAKFTIQKDGNYYALYQINGTEQGYLAPASDSYNSLTLLSNPSPLQIKILTAEEAANKGDDSLENFYTQGAAIITSQAQKDRNAFGVQYNGGVNAYQFVQQSDTPVYLYANEATPGTNFTPSANFSPMGGLVKSIKQFTLSFSGLGMVNDEPQIDLSDDFEDTDLTATYNGQPIEFPACNYEYPYVFTYNEAKTAPGVYEFKIAPGVFIMKDEQGDSFSSPELTLKYTIAATGVTYTVDPKSGSTVSEFPNPITITLENVTSIEENPNATTSDLVATFNGEKIEFPNFTNWKNPMTLSWREGQEPKEYGYYEFIIKQDMLNLTMSDGTVLGSPEIKIGLRYEPAATLNDWTSEPANLSTVKEFNGFSVTFPAATSVAQTADASFTVAKEVEGSETPEDLTTNFVVKGIENNIVTFELSRLGGEMTDGNYLVSIPEGTFMLNGDTKSPAVFFKFTVNSNLVVGNTISTYMMRSLPEEYVPLNLLQADRGMNEVMYSFNEELTINRGCTETIDLLFNNAKIASIKASATWEDSEVYADLINGGLPGVKSMLTLCFGEGDRLTPGKYQVKIPANFFMFGDEMLLGSTFNYCIGMGNYTPAEGSTLNLRMPGADSKAVLDNELIQILLKPYYSQFQVNDYQTITEIDPTTKAETVLGVLPGADVTAVLTTVRGGKTVTVAEFPTNTPAVAMQQGNIVFNLRQEGNSPIMTNGEYTLTFPENFFRTYTGGTTCTPIETEYTYKFTITGGRDANEPEQVYTVSPEAGSYEKYPTVTLTYEGATDITVANGAKAWIYYGQSTLTNEEGKYAVNITASGNKVTFTPATEVTEVPTNEYVKIYLVVPEYSYTLTYNGKQYGNVKLQLDNFTVEKKAEPTDPNKLVISAFGEGTIQNPEDLVNFTATVAEGVTIATLDFFKSLNAALYQVDKARANTLIAKYGVSLQSKTNTLTFALKDVTAEQLTEGHYQVYVPAAMYVTYDGKARTNSTEQYIDVFYSKQVGVVALDAEGMVTVYSLTGVCLYKNAEADVLRTLAPGIYVVNGKKVVVK